MTGDLNPTKGQVKRNMHLKISRFTQHFEEKLDLSMTPLDFFKQKVMPEEPIERIRPLLGRYGCTGDQQNQVMNQLSAGQKARIVFAIIAHEKPHLLLLDEPTNPLDMESIDALAVSRAKLSGCDFAVRGVTFWLLIHLFARTFLLSNLIYSILFLPLFVPFRSAASRSSREGSS